MSGPVDVEGFAVMRWAVLLVFFSSVHAQSLVVDNLSGQSPDTLAVEITYSAGADIIGLNIVLQFDSDLPAAQVAEDCGQSVGGALSLCAALDDRVAIAVLALEPLKSGTLARVDFPLTQSTPLGEHPLELTVLGIAVADGAELPHSVLSITPGSLNVTARPILLIPDSVNVAARPGERDVGQIRLSNTLTAPLTNLECFYSGDAAITVSPLTQSTLDPAQEIDVPVSCISSRIGRYFGTFDCGADGGLTSSADVRCSVANAIASTIPPAGDLVSVNRLSLTGQVVFRETSGVFGYTVQQCQVHGTGYRVETDLPLAVAAGGAASLEISALSEDAGANPAALECTLDSGATLLFGLTIGGIDCLDCSPGPGGTTGPTAVPVSGPSALVFLALVLVLAGWQQLSKTGSGRRDGTSAIAASRASTRTENSGH